MTVPEHNRLILNAFCEMRAAGARQLADAQRKIVQCTANVQMPSRSRIHRRACVKLRHCPFSARKAENEHDHARASGSWHVNCSKAFEKLQPPKRSALPCPTSSLR